MGVFLQYVVIGKKFSQSFYYLTEVDNERQERDLLELRTVSRSMDEISKAFFTAAL